MSRAGLYWRQLGVLAWIFQYLHAGAWIRAAIAMVSSARIGMSQMRTSIVLKKGWGRMSHQIFFALSMQLVLIRRLQNCSNSPQLLKLSGMLVRGNLSKTFAR